MTDSSRTEALSDDDRHALVRRVRLRVEAGPDAGCEVVSQDASLVIGSDAGVGLKLDDGAVSRFHCELTVDTGRVRIRDLGRGGGGTGISALTPHLPGSGCRPEPASR